MAIFSTFLGGVLVYSIQLFSAQINNLDLEWTRKSIGFTITHVYNLTRVSSRFAPTGDPGIASDRMQPADRLWSDRGGFGYPANAPFAPISAPSNSDRPPSRRAAKVRPSNSPGLPPPLLLGTSVYCTSQRSELLLRRANSLDRPTPSSARTRNPRTAGRESQTFFLVPRLSFRGGLVPNCRTQAQVTAPRAPLWRRAACLPPRGRCGRQ